MFNLYTASSRKIPFVSFWANKGIAFNKAATIEFDIDRFAFAQVYFDKDSYVVAIKFTNNQSGDALKITTHKSNNCKLLGDRGFCAIYKIKTGRYLAKKTTIKDIPIKNEEVLISCKVDRADN